MKPFWKPTRNTRDAATLDHMTGAVALATHIPRPSAPLRATPPVRSSGPPLVGQLIAQADALQAVSRRVEHLVCCEGVTVLAATRDHVDPAPSPYAPTVALATPAIAPRRSAAFLASAPPQSRPHLTVSETVDDDDDEEAPVSSSPRMALGLARAAATPKSPLIEATEFRSTDLSSAASSDDAEQSGSANIDNVMHQLTSHYVRRFLSASDELPDDEEETLEDLTHNVAPVEAISIPGTKPGPGLSVFTTDDLEIPKVAPYVWPAAMPVLSEQDDPYGSWFNCLGNRFQLSFDLEAAHRR